MVGGVLNISEMLSREQKGEEDNGSDYYLYVHIVHLLLLISFFDRQTSLSFSKSASLCGSALLCACILNLTD